VEKKKHLLHEIVSTARTVNRIALAARGVAQWSSQHPEE
jgi:hypothetical protein